MIILDTDIVTLFSYGKNETLRGRIEAVDDDEDLAVTIITRMEILQGRFASVLKAANAVELAVATQRFRATEVTLSDFVLLYPDDASNRHFEALLKLKKRKKLKRPDMLITSISLAHNALLITRNVSDYQGIAGLRIENWADG